MGILKTIFAVIGAVAVFGGFIALLALTAYRHEVRVARRKALDSARAGEENVQQEEEDE